MVGQLLLVQLSVQNAEKCMNETILSLKMSNKEMGGCLKMATNDYVYGTLLTKT